MKNGLYLMQLQNQSISHMFLSIFDPVSSTGLLANTNNLLKGTQSAHHCRKHE